ncbi:unnamed protein product [marine sediment metagenome]|uniref:Uncharacterized protein n=1 Tax=marine sediment metagenome TaxID=412755 RepID=X0SHI2_9ZZZZ
MNQNAFCDQPAELRLAVHSAVSDAGGVVAGYHGSDCQVALPVSAEACDKLVTALRSLGVIGDDRVTWFPLGSDNPRETLRHFGPGTAAAPRGDRPSYWKYRNFHAA